MNRRERWDKNAVYDATKSMREIVEPALEKCRLETIKVQAEHFCWHLAQLVQSKDHPVVSATLSKDRRSAKIFLDYMVLELKYRGQRSWDNDKYTFWFNDKQIHWTDNPMDAAQFAYGFIKAMKIKNAETE